MNNLIDMKRSPIESEKDQAVKMEPTMLGGQERYPYGLRISFENEEIDKLEALQGVQTNDVVVLSAVGKIVRTSSYEVEGKDEPTRSIEIQIQSIDVSTEPEAEPMTIEEALKASRYEYTKRPNRSTLAHGLVRQKRAYQAD